MYFNRRKTVFLGRPGRWDWDKEDAYLNKAQNSKSNAELKIRFLKQRSAAVVKFVRDFLHKKSTYCGFSEHCKSAYYLPYVASASIPLK